jgi:hypothetical protein
MSAPQQVHLIFDSRQYNLGPDGREVIGIIVHVPPCHCVHLFIISSLFGCRNCTFLLSFSQTKRFANLTSDFAPCVQWHSAMQLERYQIEMLVAYHWLTCCCCFDEQCILFVGARWYESFMLSGFKDLHLIWV